MKRNIYNDLGKYGKTIQHMIYDMIEVSSVMCIIEAKPGTDTASFSLLNMIMLARQTEWRELLENILYTKSLDDVENKVMELQVIHNKQLDIFKKIKLISKNYELPNL